MINNFNLLNLRNEFISQNLEGYLVPKNDMFNGEEVHSSNERLKAISNFTGSAGIALILQSKAILFIDGRYKIQVTKEVNLKDWTIQNLEENCLLKWINKNTKGKINIGFDPWLLNYNEFKNLINNDIKTSCIFVPVGMNLVDKIWNRRPKSFNSKILDWNEGFAGKSNISKIENLTNRMEVNNIDAFIITYPQDLAWLLNVRGKDLRFTPVLLAFAILYIDKTIEIFCENEIKLKINKLKIKTFKISDIKLSLSKLNKRTIGLEGSYCPYQIILWLIEMKINFKNIDSFLSFNKSIKNKVEIKNIQNSHVRDGAYLSKFIYWIKNNIHKKNISELDASKKIREIRAKDRNFISESFNTISASGANAAIVHYNTSLSKETPIKKSQIYLIDSGAHYLDGTTDITRTICFNNQSDEIINIYTRVLKGHIALAKMIFPKNVTGNELDLVARKFLWESGLDYNHGTGHGVGYVSSVHESPPNISRRKSTNLNVGMILSNEPGYYSDGNYGIRIENLLLVKQYLRERKSSYLFFETLSYCPFEKKLINYKMLNESEINWIKQYYFLIRQKLKPFLNHKEYLWLMDETNLF